MSQPAPLVLGFKDIRKTDLPQVGGKGANLGEMTAAGFPVPGGFCVTTAAWDLFLHSIDDLSALLEATEAPEADDLDALRQAAQAIRARLERAPIPREVEQAVLSAWRELDEDAPYAVRSSATLEDLADASFAGQQDTYLNVKGEEALLDAIRKCWASLFTDRAVTYRRQAGFDSSQAKLSVVVQKMVLPEVSGILFTADPVSGHRGVASIDASWGLGEALVSGRVNADLYRVQKDPFEVLEVTVGDKGLAIWPLEGGGTRTEELEGDRRRERVLDEGALRELTALACKVEDHYGRPQDIEWCLKGGELFLVQTRPITSLYPLVDEPPDDGVHVYASFNHIQVMLDPIRPLAVDALRWVFPVGREDWESPSEVIVAAGHRIYCDLTAALQTAPFSRIVPRVLPLVDDVMSRLLEALLASTKVRARLANERVKLRRLARTFFFPILRGVLRTLLPGGVSSARRRLLERSEGAVATIEARYEDATSVQERLAVARDGMARVFQVLLPVFGPIMFVGVASWRLLRVVAAGRVEGEVIDALTRGLPGNVTTQMDLELGDLADLARDVPGLPEKLESFPNDGKLDDLQEVDGSDRFLKALGAFLDAYGHRAPGEIDLTNPRWSERPSALFATMVGMLKAPEPGLHRKQEKRAQAQAAEAITTVLSALGGWRRLLARRLVFHMRALLGLREHPKYYALKFFNLMRKAALEAGAALVDRGRLEQVEDVYFLNLDEVEKALADPGFEISGLVKARRASFERARSLQPPRIMTSEGQIPALPPPENLPPGGLLGVPASSGTIEGIARVITDPTREVLHAGEILVAPFTDPGWTPLFVHASGLVMEVGGLMTHGSVVAREYGIPAVVGLDDATRKINTGDRIRVDGTSGLVIVLGPEAAAHEPAEASPQSSPGSPPG